MSATTDEPLINYTGADNLVVVPITAFIRKDGHVAVIDEDAKMLADAYPEMTKYFGYMLSEEIPAPIFRRVGVNIMGVVDREHYKSALDEDLVRDGLRIIREAAETHRDMLVYLFPFGDDEVRNKEMFDDVSNLVLLHREVTDG